MNLHGLKELVNDKVSQMRAVLYLVATERFMVVWAKASEDQQNIFIDLLNSGANRYKINKWISDNAKTEYDLMKVYDLRIIARQKGITNFYHLSKEVLIAEIEKHEARVVT